MRSLLVLGCLVVSGCVVGEIGELSLPTPDAPTVVPRDPEGIVTTPRHGDSTLSPIAGLYTIAGADVVAERFDPTSGSWVIAGTATTSASEVVDGDRTLYPFLIPVELDGVAWPQGGLVSLRVRVGDRVLPSLSVEATTQDCFATHPTWRARIASCTSGAPAITLIDTSTTPLTARRYLDAKGTSTPADTLAYYQAIGAPATVSEFITKYGLATADVPTLTYYNVGDLATGREIRCTTHATPAGTGVACTTFNYGIFGTPQQAALDLAVAGRTSGTGEGSFANVSMIYDPPITAPNAVKFIVYDAAGALLTQAQLDTHGDNTSIPNNCLNCHGSGGSYDLATQAVTGARFLPFDPSAFVFSDRPTVTRVEQEDAMRALNQTFLATAPTDTLADAVRGWYGGGLTLQGVADTSVVPAAWNTPDAAPVYRNVIAPNCRGCHASRTDALAFATPAQLRASSGPLVRAICGPSSDAAHVMPSAEASFGRFWAGPARAYLAGFLGVEAMGACAPAR